MRNPNSNWAQKQLSQQIQSQDVKGRLKQLKFYSLWVQKLFTMHEHLPKLSGFNWKLAWTLRIEQPNRRHRCGAVKSPWRALQLRHFLCGTVAPAPACKSLYDEVHTSKFLYHWKSLGIRGSDWTPAQIWTTYLHRDCHSRCHTRYHSPSHASGISWGKRKRLPLSRLRAACALRSRSAQDDAVQEMWSLRVVSEALWLHVLAFIAFTAFIAFDLTKN